MSLSNVTNNSYASTSIRFSICTIVNNDVQYQQMKTSFETAGFIEDCEYIIADNRVSNKMDAYQAIGWFLNEAKGEYILIAHQDIICHDTKNELIEILSRLEQTDNSWAVCGNAGCVGYKKCYYHLINGGVKKISAGLPKKVNSLDENFLLIKASRKPFVSPALSGYHLYGTDICINAAHAGHTSYVIPFLVNHLSMGNLTDLEKYIPDFIRTHTNSEAEGFVQTTCTKFYLGKTPEQSKFLNSPFMFELVKFWQRIKHIIP